ncbi:MAG: hypothetical protein SFV21_05725 [Rhodospirillaceae bacterium]|nr:hypothetical protein [Rhodospirillaceae bacterium]
MDSSYIKRLAIAGVFGAGVTAALFALVAFLNGVFFEEKDLMTVTPCYFVEPDEKAREGEDPGAESTATGCETEPPRNAGLSGLFERFVRSGDDQGAASMDQLRGIDRAKTAD